MNALSLRSFRFVALLALLLLTLAVAQPELAQQTTANAGDFLGEVLLILPPVLVLMALLDVWVPRRLIEQHLGRAAGVRGVGVAIFLGTAAAGPLYVAFPLAVSLLAKGARLANIVIFLGTWGTIKIPMLLLEGNFVNPRFALLRLALTAPAIVASAYLIERLVPLDSLPLPAVTMSAPSPLPAGEPPDATET